MRKRGRFDALSVSASSVLSQASPAATFDVREMGASYVNGSTGNASWMPPSADVAGSDAKGGEL